MIPLWIFRHLRLDNQKIAGLHYNQTRSNTELSFRSYGIHNHIYGRLCANCNNVLFSKLETEAAPILKRIFSCNSIILSNLERDTLARWISKTLLFSYAQSNYRDGLVPNHHFRSLLPSSPLDPHIITDLFIAEEPLAPCGYQSGDVSGFQFNNAGTPLPGIQLISHPDTGGRLAPGYIFSYQLHNLCFRALYVGDGDRTPPAPKGFYRLHPSDSKVTLAPKVTSLTPPLHLAISGHSRYIKPDLRVINSKVQTHYYSNFSPRHSDVQESLTLGPPATSSLDVREPAEHTLAWSFPATLHSVIRVAAPPAPRAILVQED